MVMLSPRCLGLSLLEVGDIPVSTKRPGLFAASVPAGSCEARQGPPPGQSGFADGVLPFFSENNWFRTGWFRLIHHLINVGLL